MCSLISLDTISFCLFNSFSNNRFLDSSNLKEFADDNFKFDESDRRSSKTLENTVGREEIARYEQFLLFNSVFKRLLLHTRKNKGLIGKGLKAYESIVTEIIFQVASYRLCPAIL